MNAWDQISQGLRELEHTKAAIEAQSTSMAKLLVGNLRHVNDWDRKTLRKLKRELQQFNANTGTWKS